MPANHTLSRSIYAGKLAEYPDTALADDATIQHRGRWSEFFGQQIGPEFGGRIILEIGCSNAVYLSVIAAKHPHTAFIGIDWKCKAIYDGAKHISETGLRNVILLRARGHDLQKLFADRELDEIWVFHPDPCDKEAELKNRLVCEQFLFDANATLKDSNSLLALKTDHADYFQSVLDLFVPHAGDVAARMQSTIREHLHAAISSIDYWHDPIAMLQTASKLFAGKATPFEHRFINKHKPILYVELRKHQAATSIAELLV